MAEEAPNNSLVLPAPMGGWVMVGIPAGAEQYRWQLMPPGQPLNSSPVRAIKARRKVIWAPDGRSVLYWTGTEVRRHFVTTAEDQQLLRSDLVDGGIVLSPDGKTLYLAEWEGRSTRHMIVNFDKRPRPVH